MQEIDCKRLRTLFNDSKSLKNKKTMTKIT